MRIVIDPGHGGTDPGAVAYGLKEKELTLDISLKLNECLKKYTNVETILTRTEDRDVTLSQRANIANTANADFFISVHINAGGGTGFESFRHPNASDKTSSIQTIIHREVANFFKGKGFIDRGIKTANYAVLRETKMAAVLLENLFIDNPRDAAFLKEEANRQAIAEAIGKGIVQAFGLKQTSKEGQTEMTKTKILFEGKELEGFIVDGKSYAEVRKLCELLGLKVTWNAQKGIVEVSK